MMMWWLFEIEVIEKPEFLTPIKSFFCENTQIMRLTNLHNIINILYSIHDKSIHILTSLHQRSSHDSTHMNRLLAIHQDIQYDDSFYKRKLMSFEFNCNIVV